MASINEMLNWAQMVQDRQAPPTYDPTASLVKTGIEGFSEGMQAGEKKKKDELDRLLKTMEIMEKATAIEYQQEAQMKARKKLNDEIGRPENDKTAGIMTEAGKVITSMTDSDSRIGKMINSNSISPKFDKWKETIKFDPKGKVTFGYTEIDRDKKKTGEMTSYQKIQFNKRVRALAKDLAIGAGTERAGQAGKMGITSYEYKPTEDEIQKYIPIARDSLLGKSKPKKTSIDKPEEISDELKKKYNLPSNLNDTLKLFNE